MKIFILILVLLLTGIAYAKDIEITGVDLTQNQTSHLSEVKSNGINGISYWPKEKKIVVVATQDLTDNDLANIKTSLLNLSELLNLSDTAIPKPKTIEERVADLEKKTKNL